MINADSVKARLKNEAVMSGRLFQELLVAYCLERTIYRISISKYNEFFTLKGGIFLYAMLEGNFARATRDIDLLANSLNNEIETMRVTFEDIFTINSDDAIIYDLNSLVINPITEFKEYQGINVSIPAMLDRTKIPVSVDIGFGDIIHPDRVLMDFPVLLDMEVPHIYGYSLASVIAEKFESIVSLGYVNSRYKDFYDIVVLIRNFDFDGAEVSEALKETFNHRGTAFDDIVAFEAGFSDDYTRVSRWNAFVKKKRAMMKEEFIEVVEEMKNFLEPIVQHLLTDKPFEGKWDAGGKKWSKHLEKRIVPDS